MRADAAETAPVAHDVLVVGHYSHDILSSERYGNRHSLGGSAAYISAVFAPLDVAYAVVSKTGRDFKYFDQVEQAPLVCDSASTTTFVNSYHDGVRTQLVEAVCDPIRQEDLPGAAKVGLACGIIDELLPETVTRLAELCDLLVGDIQGLIRHRLPDGQLGQRRLGETPHQELVGLFDFLKVSADEVQFVELEELRTRTGVLVTWGDGGCVLYQGDRELRVPGSAVEAVDPTGAGDCFVAGFSYGWCRGLDVEGAIRFANHCGRLAVKDVGVPRLTREELLEGIGQR